MLAEAVDAEKAAYKAAVEEDVATMVSLLAAEEEADFGGSDDEMDTISVAGSELIMFNRQPEVVTASGAGSDAMPAPSTPLPLWQTDPDRYVQCMACGIGSLLIGATFCGECFAALPALQATIGAALRDLSRFAGQFVGRLPRLTLQRHRNRGMQSDEGALRSRLQKLEKRCKKINNGIFAGYRDRFLNDIGFNMQMRAMGRDETFCDWLEERQAKAPPPPDPSSRRQQLLAAGVDPAAFYRRGEEGAKYGSSARGASRPAAAAFAKGESSGVTGSAWRPPRARTPPRPPTLMQASSKAPPPPVPSQNAAAPIATVPVKAAPAKAPAAAPPVALPKTPPKAPPASDDLWSGWRGADETRWNWRGGWSGWSWDQR
jgi:hypothetical protein